MSVTGLAVEYALRGASFTVPASFASVCVARRRAAAVLDKWKMPIDVDTTVLLLSEVVTNALLHGVGADSADSALIDIELAETPIGLCVTVYDPDDGDGSDVAVRHAAAQSETGRGLELVEELSASWGCRKTPDGKCVHFIVAAVERSPGESCPRGASSRASAAGPGLTSRSCEWNGGAS
jgi:anti-sigma regulatory factor (Ser/Thr protein kinase)